MQIPKDQLAGFLELCHGDEVWATNLLLDSNKEDIPKVRHMLMKSSSVPGTKSKLLVRVVSLTLSQCTLWA